MADPISIISLLGEATSLTKAVLGYALAVKNAPKELEKLSCEIKTLQDVLKHFVELVEGEYGREHYLENSTLYDTAGVRCPSRVFLTIKIF